jgi:hypothetical protein
VMLRFFKEYKYPILLALPIVSAVLTTFVKAELHIDEIIAKFASNHHDVWLYSEMTFIPPLHFYILKAMDFISSINSKLGMRLPSLIYYLSIPPIIFQIARRLKFDKNHIILFSLLGLWFPFFTQWAYLGRYYELSYLFLVLSFYSIVHYEQEEDNKGLVLLWISLVISCYTSYIGALSSMAIIGWYIIVVFIREKFSKNFLKLAGVSLSALAVSYPWILRPILKIYDLPDAGETMIFDWGSAHPFDWFSFWHTYFYMVIGAALYFSWKEKKFDKVFIGGILGFIVFIVFVKHVGHFRKFNFLRRHLSHSMVYLFLLSIIGMTFIKSKKARTTLIVIPLLFAIYKSTRHYYYFSYKLYNFTKFLSECEESRERRYIATYHPEKYIPLWNFMEKHDLQIVDIENTRHIELLMKQKDTYIFFDNYPAYYTVKHMHEGQRSYRWTLNDRRYVLWIRPDKETEKTEKESKK